MRQDPDKYAWVKYTRDLLCSHGFEKVWSDQSVISENLFLANFEQRLKDTFIQNCNTDVESSNKYCFFVEETDYMNFFHVIHFLLLYCTFIPSIFYYSYN